jgi:C4-dicarboxylate transporter DctM subunit
LDPLYLFLLALAGFFLLIAIGTPIAFSFAIVGIIGVFATRGLEPALALLGHAPLEWASMQSLVVVPLFILMGQFAFNSGISGDLYDVARKWVGRLPGGVALATMLACTGFAACTGSSLASAASMGTVAWPEMRQLSYSPRLATGCIAAGGSLGILIPPSIMFIIYGGLTETSVGKLFIAGILPGLLLSGCFFLLMFTMCKLRPELGPPSVSRFSWIEKFKALKGVWGMLLLFFLIIGSLYLGVCSPSEAGALGAFGALVIALARGRLPMHDLIDALKSTAKLTSMILTITIGAMIFNFFITVSGFSGLFADWITALPVSRYVILGFVLFIYVPLGMVMDALAIILLTLPVVFPVLIKLGFDPIWFGVIIVVMTELAIVTPPVGINVYVTSGVTKIPLEVCFQGIIPFAIVMMIVVILLVLFPEIALFLPTRMY